MNTKATEPNHWSSSHRMPSLPRLVPASPSDICRLAIPLPQRLVDEAPLVLAELCSLKKDP